MAQINSKRRGPATLARRGKDGIPGKDELHRWRALREPADFERTSAALKERARKLCEFEKNVRGTEGTGENEWFTPNEFLNTVRDVMGTIDLDPATSAQAQQIVKADKFFTIEDDGLTKPWHGRVWLNPPYAQPHIAMFVSKLVNEWNAGNLTEAILLTHNYTDTTWFHEAVSCAKAICFTRGRVRFYDPSGSIAAPTQGQAFIYYGPKAPLFAEKFSKVGFIVAPW